MEPVPRIFRRRFSLLVLLVFSTVQATASTLTFSITFKITEYNPPGKRNFPLDNCIFSIRKNDLADSSFTCPDSLEKFILPFGNDYVISIGKSGYVTKRFGVSTKNIPEKREKEPFNEMLVETSLFRLIPGSDYSCLDNPVAKIYFNAAPDVDDFDYDRAYTDSVSRCIQRLMTGQAEAEKDTSQGTLRKKDNGYSLAVYRGDSAVKAENWAAAKMFYQQAHEIKPGEIYPVDQLAACDLHIKREAMKQDYEYDIAAGDSCFLEKKWNDAQKFYLGASGLMPGETYPAKLISFCRTETSLVNKSDTALSANEYSFFIRIADEDLSFGRTKEAARRYRMALAAKPGDLYAKNQLAKISGETKREN
ncbi:MAG TPA: hypothetical protein VFU15_00930 [Bacteroidia bacterium]|nr:hypothetical protein [Bacteroidia bacterium]